MKKLAASCAVLFGLSSMVACSNPNENQNEQENKDLLTSIENPVEIEFWHAMSGPNEAAVNQLVEDFNATVGQEKESQLSLSIKGLIMT